MTDSHRWDEDDEGKTISITQAGLFVNRLTGRTSPLPAPTKSVPFVKPLGAIAISSAIGVVEDQGQRVHTILMANSDYLDVRMFCRDEIDIVAQKEWLQKGCLARMWGAYIVTAKELPQGTAYVLGECGDVYSILQESK